MSYPAINLEVARKVLKTVDAGLVSGLGTPEPGRMCVEAAVSYALGLPHGDDPGCVAPALRRLKIRLNDSRWASPQKRAGGLRRLALAQLGSADVLNEKVFVRQVVEMTIRKIIPLALHSVATLKHISDNHKKALLAAAEQCEKKGTRKAALIANKTAYAADAAADADADAAYAADAAADADAYASNNVLAAFAEEVVQILIQMSAPGCKWLYLTETK